MTGSFVLDETGNPHPEMLNRALALRTAARRSTDHIVRTFWLGYLTAMCDATGETSAAINGWLDSHDDEVPAGVIEGTRVVIE